MPLPSGLNNLAKLTLLASDESYFSLQFPVLSQSSLQPLPDTPAYNIFPQYDIVPARAFVVDRTFVDNTTGFKAIAFRNVETNEAIIAFGGTDGLNAQDWASNVEHLGWNQWAGNNGRNRTDVFAYLNSLDLTTKIHFTGQSLGGALAQYASYEYVRNKTVQFKPEDGGQQNIEFDPSFDKSRLTLTTFNAFGGQLGLEQNTTAFNSAILTGLGASAHFVIDGDLISRLGDGHVGGPVYQLEYVSTRINAETGQPYFLDLIDGHRIETGFYANVTPLEAFDEAQTLTAAERSAYYLPMASLQKMTGLLSNILNDKDVSPVESLPRLYAGIAAGLAFGNQSELNTLVQAVLKNQADAGKLTSTQYAALQAIRFGAVRPVAGAVYPITLIAAGFVDAAELGINGIQSAYAAVKEFLGLPGTAGPSLPTALPSHTLFEKMKAYFSLIPGVLSDNESVPAGQITRLNLDLTDYAQVLLDNPSSSWRTDTLAWLRTKAVEAEFKPAEINQIAVALYNSMSAIPGLAPTEITLLKEERDAFILDTASGFANAVADFTQKITNVAFTLGEAITSVADVQVIDHAYAAELKDPRLPSTAKAAIEEAREIVQRAGQTVVIQTGVGPNPFHLPGYVPGGVSSATVEEKLGEVFRLSLPFAAGVGGQRVALQLQGPQATQLSAVTDEGVQPVGLNGTVDVMVPEGVDQLLFTLIASNDIAADATVALSATLVDARGTATHATHVESTISVKAFVGTTDPRYASYAEDWSSITDPNYEGVAMGAGGFYHQTLRGSAGSDTVAFPNGYGDDTIYGNGGNDYLVAGRGHDVISGGDGHDTLIGDYIDDQPDEPWLGFFPGDTGPDPRSTKDGRDYLDGGAGNDLLGGGGNSDRLIGGAGDDVLWGDVYTNGRVIQQNPDGSFVRQYTTGVLHPSDDVLEGGDGNDTLSGDSGDDMLDGGTGNDILIGDTELSVNATLWYPTTPGNDFLTAGPGNDRLWGNAGDDVLLGGPDNDVLFGDDDGVDSSQEGDDWLEGGDGLDQLFGRGGNDTLIGDAGADVLSGGTGNDMLDGGEGDDAGVGGAGDDTILGGAGADQLDGEAGHDVLFGDDGNDVLIGGEGVDEIDGGQGDDLMSGGADTDTILGGEGNDELQGGSGADVLAGETGDDRIFGELGDDQMFGGDGNDGLRGDDGNDEIEGGAGDDILVGDADGQIGGSGGNDLLIGGTGNDTLVGGGGQDTYRFNLGDGRDTIVDTVTDGTNRILFGAGITAADLTYTQTATTLTIAYSATDAVELNGFNQNTVLGSLGVSTFAFADGSVVNLADLYPTFTNHTPTLANPLADQTVPEEAPLSFTVPVNTFADQDAGDVLTFAASLDNGTALPSWLSFNPTTRTFTGMPDDAQIGTIALRVTARDGRNEMVSDTFNLTVTNVNEAPMLATPLANQAATKDDPFTFVVPAGTFTDVDAGDSLTHSATLADNSPLPAWLSFNPTTRTFTGIPQLADVGTLNVKVTATDAGNLSASGVFVLTIAHGFNEITGTPDSDVLTGTIGKDWMKGLAGDDQLDGREGNDLLEGGDGNDTLVGGDGTNTLDGGAGNDQLYALGGGTNVLIGGAGADRLEGYTGNDTFQGGPGNDTIVDPYGGLNVYLFGRGDGQDTIYPNFGTVRFSAGVLPTDVMVRGNRDLSLALSITGTSDQLTLTNWMNPFNTTRIDRVEFADGTVWTGATLQAMALTGTVGDDYLGGTNSNDSLSGLGGNDLIEARDGDDVLDGGAGTDTLWGGLGNDTYIFGRGYGADLIQDDGGLADKIRLSPGIVAANVTLLQNGSDVLLSIDQSPTQVTFTGIEQIVFNDSTTWDAAAIASHTLNGTVNTMTGTAGNDTFVVDHTQDTVIEAANQGTDTIQSRVSYILPDNVENLTLTSYFNVTGSGNMLDNVIIGNSGNNKLYGGGDYWGADTDTLQGGLGDDSYIVIGNNDRVIEALNEGIDTIQLIGDANRGWNYSLPQNVENLIVGSAVQGLLGARSFYGNALDNMIQGDTDWSNSIDGGVGADTMIGGRGSDTYVVDNPGDVIKDAGSTDTVRSSINYVLGTGLENLILTGASAINGTGNEFNNVLTGNSAANVLTGGLGDDTYIIGAGDTIVELPGQGADTVSTDQSYTLGADLENVTLIGTEAVNATGNSRDNVLTGNSAANVLDGGAGADQLIGGEGDDTYYVGAGDTVVEQSFGGTDTVISDATFTLGGELENLTLTGTAALNGTGNELDNVLTGNVGTNVLTGGAGDDMYVVSAGDTVIENADEGTDTIHSDVTWTLGANVENLTLTGTAAIDGTGNAANNVLAGNSAANVLTGGAGDDTYVVDGADTILELVNGGTDTVLSSATVALSADLEQLTLTGSAAINGTGNALSNTLIGNGGANTLDGGAGADSLSGGAGDDTYVVDNAGDTVAENTNEGIDTVQSSLTYTLGANVENLTLTGSGAINGTGNALNNVLTGNSAVNVLTGGAGNDMYIVDSGDTVTESASQGTDTVHSLVSFTLGANIENLTLLGTGAINATGNTLNNVLVGNSGANVLNGGTGSDAMSGGAGDDTYVVEVAGDTVTENANEGTDTVQSSVIYTLGANIDNLTLTGTTAINGTGNTLDNVLTGNSAANVLTGGAGNDTYVVGTGDTVTEAAGAGTDTVQSSISWTLGTNLENLTLTGATAINGTGNALNNVLTGNSAANVLNGGTGADAMIGGAGNDTYVVDQVGDTVTERANEGTDLVQSAVTYTLSSDVENLTLTGSTAINATGNALNNTLTGNTGNNILDGGLGADTMAGGTGNDTYVVDNVGDVVTEAASAGTDTVQSASTYILGSNVENLTLTGAGAINGTGNAVNNVLTGNSAANVLNGGAGSDSMAGGTGDDTYVVDVAGDVVTELANEGTDTVQSAITYTLGVNLENLTLTGTVAINGTGNALDNVLTGNSGANVLTGGAGNDTYVVGTGDSTVENAGAGTDTVQSAITWTLGANVENLVLTGTAAIHGTGNTANNTLIGNSANNVLTGLGGNDTYLYSRGSGQDTVVDTAGTSDTLGFGAMINPLDLVISRQVNDLRIALHGTTDQVTIQNWYGGATNQTETIRTSNGQALLNTQVDQLIQAMASFSQQSGLTWDQAIDQRPQEVQAVLAASWQ